MFKVREKQLRKVLNSIKTIFKKTSVYSVSTLTPKINNIDLFMNVDVMNYNFDYFKDIFIKSYLKDKMILPENVSVISDLSFFNNLKQIFRAVEISEVPKKKFIEILSHFHKKTTLTFNNVEIQALYIDVPVSESGKISFENGKLIFDSDSTKLDVSKSDVVIYKEEKNGKSKVAVLND